MKLIDADARVTVQSFDIEHEEYNYQEMSVAEALDFATDEGCPPVVDAEPVVHGRWIEDRTHIMCSVCGARYKDEIVFMPDACMSGQIYDGLERCPHCGARMDGGELNDT